MESKTSFVRNLKKIYKKYRGLYSATIQKMDEILEVENVSHYKNLKNPMERFKRVHVMKSFVLIFQYIEKDNKIIFHDLDYHNKIYRK